MASTSPASTFFAHPPRYAPSKSENYRGVAGAGRGTLLSMKHGLAGEGGGDAVHNDDSAKVAIAQAHPLDRISRDSIAEDFHVLHSNDTDETDMLSQSRRRSSRRGGEDGSSADESAPIIPRGNGKGRDYGAVSPVINAKTSGAGGTEGNSDGAGPVERARGPHRDRERERARDREASAQRAARDTERKETSWWRGVMDKYGSVELENKGSVARDHLALERTFLAWLRTSLSFASIGIAVTQLFRLNTTISSSNPSSPATDSPQAHLRHVGKPLGATFIAISILILFIGFHRYFESQHYVIRGKFPASRGSILIVAFVAGALIVTSLVVILSVAPKAFEK